MPRAVAPGRLEVFMKGFLFGLSLFSVVSMAAPAHEAVTIKNLEQFVNLMPPLPPGGVAPRSTLTLDVVSTGCTRPSDFKIVVEQKADLQVLTVVRTKPDLCEVVAHPVE